MRGLQQYILIFFTGILLLSCNRRVKTEPTDTPTSGEVKICVDESFSLLFDTEIYVFESIYERAKIHVNYIPESNALPKLLADSCKLVVMSRDLTAEEKTMFEKNNIFPRSVKIAEDAVALVINNENMDSTFTIEEVKSILLGNDSLWSQVNAASELGKITVVFDNQGSANARYMKDSLLMKQVFAPNVFAVKSNPEVIEYVSKNKNAIGILSVNWISDKDDSLSRGFLKKVRVAGISRDTSTKAYKPFQGYIKSKEYPFCRDVYMINRQSRAGLGTGFVSFVAGEKGQLIILKSGLVPSIAPVRMIKIGKD